MSDNDIIENIKEITVYFDHVIMCHIGYLRIVVPGNGVGRTLLAGFAYESKEMGMGLCGIANRVCHLRMSFAYVVVRIVMKPY